MTRHDSVNRSGRRAEGNWRFWAKCVVPWMEGLEQFVCVELSEIRYHVIGVGGLLFFFFFSFECDANDRGWK